MNTIVNTPKYQVIAEELRNRIASGAYDANQKMPTEGDWARQYGVSRQTVRQALDMLEKEGIISRRQGSGTFAGGSPRKWSQTRRVGVIVTFINDYIFPSMLRSIESVLSQNGYSMELMATNNRIDAERRVLRGFMERPIDGLLVEGTKTALPNPNLALYRSIREKGVPIVFFNDCYPYFSDVVSVTPDEEAGTRTLMKYLLDKGCRRIGGLFKSDNSQGIRRYEAYMNACLEAGLELNDESVLWHNSENKRIFLDAALDTRCADVLRAQDGFLCYNDEIALYLIDVLRRLGVTRFPRIASFDDSILRKTSEIPFVSLTHPKEALGEAAALKMVHIIGKRPERSQRIPWGPLAE